MDEGLDYKLYTYASANLDYLARHFYFTIYLYYLARKIALLFSFDWLDTLSVVLFILFLIWFTISHMKAKMNATDMSYGATLIFYLQCRHIFPS